jgi:2-dehydropantoate 2-reductase
MRIIIIGAGAIGSYFGASLIMSGNEVVFLDREPAAVMLRKSGITLRKKDSIQKVSGLQVLSSYSKMTTAGNFDLAILAVKSYDTHHFLENILDYHVYIPAILSLQNGVENEIEMAKLFGWERVIAGSVTTAIGREGPGEVVVEKLRGVGIAGSSSLVSQIVESFSAAGLKARYYPSIADMKWSKMLTNLPANASAAILHMLPWEIFQDQGLFKMEMEQIRESAHVMKGLGLRVTDLPGTPVRLLGMGAKLPEWIGKPVMGGVLGRGRGGKKPSFLIEVLNHSGKSEVQYLNGAVVKYGAKLDIPTPVNSVLSRTLQAIVEGKMDEAMFIGQAEKLLKLIETEKNLS